MLHTLFKNAVHFEGRMTVSKVDLSLKKLHPQNMHTQKYLTKKKNQKKDCLFFINHEEYTKISLKKQQRQKKAIKKDQYFKII